MMHPTTASHLTRSFADDRAREAARDRRLAQGTSAPTPASPRPVRFTTAARFAARIVSPFRSQLATR